MNKSILSTAIAALSAAALTTSAAPAGYENNGGFWLGGTLNVSPFAEFGYVHDDNPHSLRDYTKKRIAANPDARKLDESSDAFIYKAGANLLLPGNHWKAEARAFYAGEAYSSDYVNDRNDWAETFRLSGTTDRDLRWSLFELYQNIRYDDEFELSRSDRSELVAQGDVDAALSDKSRLLLGAFFRRNDYDDKTCYDYSSFGGKLGFAHRLTEKTDWTLTTVYTVFDKDKYDSDAYGINLLAGLRTRATQKLTFDVAAGAEFFKDFEYKTVDVVGVETARDADDEVGFTYKVSMHWKATERLSVSVSGYSDYQPAEDVDDNSLYSSTIGATLAYRPGDSWRLRAGAAYRRDDYNRDLAERLDPNGNPYSSVENGETRTDDEFTAFADLSYALTDFCSIFVNWRYTDVSSSVSGFDYDRQRYGAGVALKY